MNSTSHGSHEQLCCIKQKRTQLYEIMPEICFFASSYPATIRLATCRNIENFFLVQLSPQLLQLVRIPARTDQGAIDGANRSTANDIRRPVQFLQSPPHA